jgi:hypothetical protein
MMCLICVMQHAPLANVIRRVALIAKVRDPGRSLHGAASASSAVGYTNGLAGLHGTTFQHLTLLAAPMAQRALPMLDGKLAA